MRICVYGKLKCNWDLVCLLKTEVIKREGAWPFQQSALENWILERCWSRSTGTRPNNSIGAFGGVFGQNSGGTLCLGTGHVGWWRMGGGGQEVQGSGRIVGKKKRILITHFGEGKDIPHK